MLPAAMGAPVGGLKKGGKPESASLRVVRCRCVRLEYDNLLATDYIDAGRQFYDVGSLDEVELTNLCAGEGIDGNPGGPRSFRWSPGLYR